jgi:signal transduction histidine kinase
VEQDLVDSTWPEPLARRIGSLMAVLVDATRPGTVVVPEVVRGLMSIPGIHEASLTDRDEPIDPPCATRVPVGPGHLLNLRGPNATRPDVLQAVGLLADALAVRLWEVPATEAIARSAAVTPPDTDDQLEFFRSIGRHAPMFIAVHDPDGTLRWISRVPKDKPNQNDLRLSLLPEWVHPDDRRRLLDLRARMTAESLAVGELDARIMGADDQWRHAHIVVCNLTDEPAVRGLVTYASDVTALRQSEDSQRIASARLRTLIDSIDVAIVVVDERMCIAEINPKALKLLQVNAAPRTVVGCTVAELAEMADRGMASGSVLKIAADFADRSISGGVPVRGEELHLGDIVVEADYLPIDLDGTVRGHFLVGREVTGRVVAQHALETRNRELHHLATLKNEFLATISHELRTPLTAASSLLELLGEDDKAAPMPVDMVDALRRNNSRLLSIVEDLLLLARFESGQLPLETRPVSIGTLFSQTLAPLRAEAAQYGISIVEKSDREDVQLNADPHWLARMIRYVVSGSFTAGRPASRIFLRGEMGRRYYTLTISGDTLRTADNGPRGTPGGERERIGIGLGLTLARAIAARHGGELRIAGHAEGAAVRISLPTIETSV